MLGPRALFRRARSFGSTYHSGGGGGVTTMSPEVGMSAIGLVNDEESFAMVGGGDGSGDGKGGASSREAWREDVEAIWRE